MRRLRRASNRWARSKSSDPNAPKVEKSGKEVVDAVCSACHGTGALGAPKIGDKAAWAPHLGEGLDHLAQNAIKGIRQMPPRGGNPDLSDTEVTRAVAFMANQSGAKFKEPASKPEPAKAAPAAPASAAAPAALLQRKSQLRLRLHRRLLPLRQKAMQQKAGKPRMTQRASLAMEQASQARQKPVIRQLGRRV